MRRIVLLALLPLLVLSQGTKAKEPAWTLTCDGTSQKIAYPISIQCDAAGNVYLLAEDLTKSRNFLLIKYSSGGVLQWSAYPANGLSAERSRPALAVSPGGNSYVAFDQNTDSGAPSCWIVKFNSLGQQQWTVNSPVTNSWTSDIALDNAEAVIVTYPTFNDSETSIVKRNSDGSAAWKSTFTAGGGYLARFMAVATDDLRNIYVAGNLCSGVTPTHVLVAKYNSSGDQQWAYTRQQPGCTAYSTDMIALSGTSRVAVASNMLKDTTSCVLTLSLTAAGGLEWAQEFFEPGSKQELVTGLGFDQSNNLYMVATRFDDPVLQLAKYSPSGTEVLAMSYRGVEGNLAVFSARVLPSGQVVIAGNGKITSTTALFDSDGSLLWEILHPEITWLSTVRGCLAVDSSSNVIIAGEVYQSGNRRTPCVHMQASTGDDLWNQLYVFPASDDDATAISANVPGHYWIGGQMGGNLALLDVTPDGTLAKILSGYETPSILPDSAVDLAIGNSPFLVGNGKSAFPLNYSHIETSFRSIWRPDSLEVLPVVGPDSLTDRAFDAEINNGGGLWITGSTKRNDGTTDLYITAPELPHPYVFETPGYYETGLKLAAVRNGNMWSASMTIDSAYSPPLYRTLIRQLDSSGYQDGILQYGVYHNPGDVYLDAISTENGSLFATWTESDAVEGPMIHMVGLTKYFEILFDTYFGSETPGPDYARAVAFDCNYNVYVAGFTIQTGVPYSLLLKYDPAGTLLWSRIGAEKLDTVGPIRLAATSDGPVYASASYEVSSGNTDWLIKAYQQDGSPIWTDTYGNSGVDRCKALALDLAGDLVAVGQVVSSATWRDAAILKYSAPYTCCEGTTGNVNQLGIIDLSDLSMLIAYLTIPRTVLPCPSEANVNGLGIIDLSDLSLLIAYLTIRPGPTLPNCPAATEAAKLPAFCF